MTMLASGAIHWSTQGGDGGGNRATGSVAHLGYGGGVRLADLVGVLDQHVRVDVRAGKADQPDQDREYVEA
eukprot:15467344-Alexandrium_andersonii.AAC.1